MDHGEPGCMACRCVVCMVCGIGMCVLVYVVHVCGVSSARVLCMCDVLWECASRCVFMPCSIWVWRLWLVRV